MSTSSVPSGPPITYAAAGVDVEAGDRAVELMKASVARAQRPEVLGGLGGFAGLFDASALSRMTRPVLATSAPTASAPRSPSPRPWTSTTRSASTWSAWWSTTSWSAGAEPLFMTDYIACRQGGARADRGDRVRHRGGVRRGGHRPDRRRDGRAPRAARSGRVRRAPAPRPVWSSTTTSSARTGCVAGDVVVAMASSGLHSNGYSLVRRSSARPAGRWTATSPSSAAPSARSCWSRPGSTPRDLLEPGPHRRHRRPRPQPRHRRRARGEPGPGAAAGRFARVDRSTWTPPAIFELVRELGRVPVADLERTLNLGVGFVAVVPADQADAVVREAARATCPPGSWGTSATARAPRSRTAWRSCRAPRVSTGARSRSSARTPPDPSARAAEPTSAPDHGAPTQGHRHRAVPASGEGGSAPARCPVVTRNRGQQAPRGASALAGGPLAVLVVESSSASSETGSGVAVRRSVKLSLKLAQIGVRAEVLQLPGNLGLLGFGPAAPHGVDPLMRLPGRHR